MDKQAIKVEHESRHKHFERPTTERPPALFSLIILTSIIGILAGSAGFWITQSVLSKKLVYSNFNNQNNTVSVNLEQPLTNLAQKHSASIAGVYKKTVANTLESPLFSPSDYLGAATVVTSDGWLMSTDQVLKNTEALVSLGDSVYPVIEIKTDLFSNVVFLKIEASSLSPVDFQLAQDIKVGEKLFSNLDLPNTAGHTFHSAYLSHDHYVVDKFLSTDKLDYYLKTDELLDESLNLEAAPYFNDKGDVLGLAYTQNQDLVLIPAQYLKQALNHFLDDTKRVTLGLRYVDLENNSGFLAKGNLVYSQAQVAIEPASLAAKAGLKAGDQIVAVNTDVISSKHTLTSILQNYRIGDKVMFRILRNQVEQDIEVQL
jgi:S1-C subfamily serine protease